MKNFILLGHAKKQFVQRKSFNHCFEVVKRRGENVWLPDYARS